MAKHARRRGGRHEARRPEYQGWASPPLDEADQLLLAQSGDTPPMGMPRIQVQAPPPPVYYYPPQPAREPWPLHVRMVVIAGSVMATVLFLIVAVIGIGIAMAPPPAEAGTGQRPPVTQTVYMDGDQVKLKIRAMCPTEDSCDVDYRGAGTYTVTRVTP